MGKDPLDLIVKGNLVLPHDVLEDAAVGVKDGVIVGLYKNEEAPAAKNSVDASGRFVFPGGVDAHVHSYSDPEETFDHATPAAAAGGVTTIVEMPYDRIGKVCTAQLFDEKIERVKSRAKVDVALLATIEKEGQLENVAPLVKRGAVGFKLSLTEADPVRFPRIEDDVLFEALQEIGRHGVPVGFHAENDAILTHLIKKFRKEGKTHPKAHCDSRPPVTETLAVLKLLEMAYWIDVKLHLYHISHPRSIELVEIYKDYGADVTVETCPHYLLLNYDDMDRLKAYAKINPPMRKKEEVEMMWDFLKCGLIDMVTSDHGPWPYESKQAANIFDNPSGSPGVETLFPLMFSEGVMKRDIHPVFLSELLCENPAKRFNVFPRKGQIALGADADFTLIDPAVEWTIRAENMHSHAGWTPFDGMKVTGKIIQTILRGQTIYDGNEVLAEPGYGQFVPAIKGE
jgi:allantoinase